LCKNSYVERVCNSGTSLWNSGKEGKEKRMSINDKLKYNICEGRGHNDIYGKLSKKRGLGDNR
jgi:hypothetical protein